jgi:L-aminopeptidase/D-esterase-like protein
MRVRLAALALAAAGVTAVLPAAPAAASGPCFGAVDTNCDYTRCDRNCFVLHCRVYVDPLVVANAALCLQ